MSKEEIERWTVLEVNETKEGCEEQGINDLRMGVSTNHEVCKTCHETIECPGHFGHIKLAKPVYHIGFIETVAKVLRCICFNCGKLRYNYSDNDGKMDALDKLIKSN